MYIRLVFANIRYSFCNFRFRGGANKKMTGFLNPNINLTCISDFFCLFEKNLLLWICHG
jgi:hypothetical protein